MRAGALVVVVGAAVSVTAHADRIAVEAYVGNRPADAERVIAPLRPILERHGFIAAPEVLRKRFAAHVWRSGGLRTAGPAIFKKIEDGIREFDDAKVAAVTTLKAGLGLARANPVAWANEPKYRDQVRRGLLYFALSLNLRAKEAQAQAGRSNGKRQAEQLERASADEQARDEAMDELLRGFPAFVVKADDFGAQAEGLFLDASKRARQNGGGSIELDVDDPNVIVYVDEAQQPRKTTIGNLAAGRHRVLVVGAAEAREYTVDVMASRRSRLAVTWSLDASVKLGDWAGFTYASDNERQREQEMLAALVAPGTVDIAASLTVKAGGVGVIGQSYDLQRGKPLASCTLGAGRQADPDAAEEFVRCLAGEKGDRRPTQPDEVAKARSASAGSTTPTPTTERPQPAVAAPTVDEDKIAGDDGATTQGNDTPATAGSRRRWMLWTAIGSLGVAAIGGGLTAKFALDARAAGDEYSRVCAVMCTGEEAKAIIADQDTAKRRAWIAAGVSGVAVIGGVVMLVLWHRSGSSRATPTAQVGDGGASLGWSVAF